MAIESGDSLVAGICRAQAATLMTRDRCHFDRVEGLTVIDA